MSKNEIIKTNDEINDVDSMKKNVTDNFQKDGWVIEDTDTGFIAKRKRKPDENVDQKALEKIIVEKIKTKCL